MFGHRRAGCGKNRGSVPLGIKKEYGNIFVNTDYKVVFTSIKDMNSIKDLKNILKDKLNVFSGPSGVGKSSVMNAVQPDFMSVF